MQQLHWFQVLIKPVHHPGHSFFPPGIGFGGSYRFGLAGFAKPLL